MEEIKTLEWQFLNWENMVTIMVICGYCIGENFGFEVENILSLG